MLHGPGIYAIKGRIPLGIAGSPIVFWPPG
jgi:hypothetical protein